MGNTVEGGGYTLHMSTKNVKPDENAHSDSLMEETPQDALFYHNITVSVEPVQQ